jgi:hypothetical protein
MARRRTTLLVLGAALVFALLAAFAARSGSSASKPASVSFLFSQDAAAGTLVGPDDQHLVLTLKPVRNWLTRFTDRPIHQAETVDLRDFLARWNARFAKHPPNGVLSFRVARDPYPRDMVLELSHPRYDRAARTITYDARRIKRSTDTLAGTKHKRKPVVYPIPARFESASLFIDNALAQNLVCCR